MILLSYWTLTELQENFLDEEATVRVNIRLHSHTKDDRSIKIKGALHFSVFFISKHLTLIRSIREPNHACSPMAAGGRG